MTSWRDSASQRAQDDLDELLKVGLEFAQQYLARCGELYPFAAAVGGDGETELIGATPDLDDDHPHPDDVLETCVEALTTRRHRIRAGAIVADVRLPELGCDAIRVELEHAEGLAITVLLPYTRKHAGNGIDYGGMRVQLGDRRLWPESELATN